jgi:hypothetical protein
MKKQIYLILGMIILLSIVSVNAYTPHKINTDLNFTISSNNATICKIKTIDKPTGLNLLDLSMNKNETTFYLTVSKKNFTELGQVCFNIQCTDGINYETGSKCYEVTPNGRNDNSNIYFILFLIIIIYTVAFIGFFGKNEIVSILGGMFMIGLSIYIINNGIIIYRDWITNYFAYLTLAIGAFFSIVSGMSLYEDL